MRPQALADKIGGVQAQNLDTQNLNAQTQATQGDTHDSKRGCTQVSKRNAGDSTKDSKRDFINDCPQELESASKANTSHDARCDLSKASQQDSAKASHTDSIKAIIYNISSVGGYRVSALSTPYCMSKFALTALSEGLALDLAPFGIAVVNVMPTGFRTEFLGESACFGGQALGDYERVTRGISESMGKLQRQAARRPRGLCVRDFPHFALRKAPA